MTTEEMLLQLIEGQKQMSADISDIKKDIAELKQDTKISRTATNKLIENFEDLVKVLNDTNTVYFKVH